MVIFFYKLKLSDNDLDFDEIQVLRLKFTRIKSDSNN